MNIELKQTNPLLEIQESEDLKQLFADANMEITSRQDAEQSIIIKDMIVKMEKKVDAVRDTIVRPHNDFVKQVNTLAKTITWPLAEAKKLLNKKQIAYNEEVEAEARKQAEEIRKLWEWMDAEEEVNVEVATIEREAWREKVQRWINYNNKIVKVDWELLPKKYWNIKDMEITPNQLLIKKDMKWWIRIDWIIYEE